MENTFTVDITFLTKVLQEDNETWKEENVTKSVKFKELDQRDREQHKLHFKISSIFQIIPGKGGSPDKVGIESDNLYDLSERALDLLMVVGEGITEADKTCILVDSFAILRFGRWFADNKATPFFLSSIIESKK